MNPPTEILHAALNEKFGSCWRIVWGRVYVTVASFNGETYSPASIQVLLGRTTDAEILETIAGFGSH